MKVRFGIVALAALLMAGCADLDDPPPAPIVAACDGCGSYTSIWFDKDSANLSDVGRRGVDGLLDLWVEGRATLKLVGHADVFGTAKRNLDLSRARAENLKAYIEHNGKNAVTILVEARGNTQRLVLAPRPGEPQNQRVEVTLQSYAARPPCYKDRDRQLTEWHRRNCVPIPLIGRSQDCADVQRQLPPPTP